MLLTRLGNKQRIANKIIPYFPKHDCYIEPFFGAGGMFFSKQRSRYNMVNDLDSDVYNLFMVLKDKPDEFYKAFESTPYHEDLLRRWKKEQEEDPIWKAVRFVFLSNYTFLGKQDTIHTTLFDNNKKSVLDRVNLINKELSFVKFQNKDFRKFLSTFSLRHDWDIDRAFIYCDPPYLDATRTYEGFSDNDVIDLLDCLMKTKSKFAYSEFDNDFIINQAKERELNIIHIGERCNLNNRRNEVLLTNYDTRKPITLF